MPAYAIKHRSPKSWHKITIQVDSRMSDAVAAYLAELTGTGLEISSPDNSLTKTVHTFPTEKITGYLPIGPQESDKKGAHKKITGLQQFLAKACHIFPDCHAPQLLTETILEEDWGETWKSFFTSFQITPTLTIKPSWEVVEEQERTGDANKAVIEMDSGLAFGTGHHASTQLALLLLEELFQNETKKPERILDVGTGSGILAMA